MTLEKTTKKAERTNDRLFSYALVVTIVMIALLVAFIVCTTSCYLCGNEDLHYNYGIIKDVDGVWYKTTYFEFEDDSQSISVYYGSELFDYAMDYIKPGDYVIVVWSYETTEAETFRGDITVPWLVRLVKNGEVVFPTV